VFLGVLIAQIVSWFGNLLDSDIDGVIEAIKPEAVNKQAVKTIAQLNGY